jgi:thiol-disulfide isomerase/thioredoxin
MFWTPGCKYCALAKPIFAEAAERAATELTDVSFAAVDCSRNEATCVRQQVGQ